MHVPDEVKFRCREHVAAAPIRVIASGEVAPITDWAAATDGVKAIVANGRPMGANFLSGSGLASRACGLEMTLQE